MDLVSRAELVRAHRLELKQGRPSIPGRAYPRASERDLQSYINRTGSMVDTDQQVYDASREWDKHVYRQRPAVRRRMKLMGQQEGGASEQSNYAGYYGLSARERRRAKAGGASVRATFGRSAY